MCQRIPRSLKRKQPMYNVPLAFVNVYPRGSMWVKFPIRWHMLTSTICYIVWHRLQLLYSHIIIIPTPHIWVQIWAGYRGKEGLWCLHICKHSDHECLTKGQWLCQQRYHSFHTSKLLQLTSSSYRTKDSPDLDSILGRCFWYWSNFVLAFSCSANRLYLAVNWEAK